MRPNRVPANLCTLYSTPDFTGGKTGIRIALLAGKDQDVVPGVGERKIAEESTGRGLIGMKIAIYENEPRQ
jgi:hypothetical protein